MTTTGNITRFMPSAAGKMHFPESFLMIPLPQTCHLPSPLSDKTDRRGKSRTAVRMCLFREQLVHIFTSYHRLPKRTPNAHPGTFVGTAVHRTVVSSTSEEHQESSRINCRLATLNSRCQQIHSSRLCFKSCPRCARCVPEVGTSGVWIIVAQLDIF